LGKLKDVPHAVTDSAASATSMTSGIKTYNGAINVDPTGKQVVPLARTLQAENKFSIGVVTSVQISHATPAAAYANNVTRADYQDLARDLLGLRSISHRALPLSGVDVLIGAGWGVTAKADEGQGNNFEPGNVYLADRDLRRISIENGGKYRVVQRTKGKPGGEHLLAAARQSYEEGSRFFGYFGIAGGKGRKAGHLPYQTADGEFNPVKAEYSIGDVRENPTLAEMTRVALVLLSRNKNGFWLMIESGDVDWANHSNDIDNSIGAVLSGDEAFRMVTRWATKNNVWNDTAVIVTSDHGHYLVLDQPDALIERRSTVASQR
jgi:alkaline phosphatase